MDDVITLISDAVTSHDDYGNEEITRTERSVMCKVFGVSRNEFYSASQAGLKPEITVRLSNHADYVGEKTAKFHDEEYDIIRVYRSLERTRDIDADSVELTLQKKVSNG